MEDHNARARVWTTEVTLEGVRERVGLVGRDEAIDGSRWSRSAFRELIARGLRRRKRVSEERIRVRSLRAYMPEKLIVFKPASRMIYPMNESE